MIRPKVEDTVFSGQMQVNKPGFYARKGPREPLVESVVMIVGILKWDLNRVAKLAEL